MPKFAPSPVASRGRPRQSGFTLIEVLVAILVLSFGMLGVVGLQMAAMQANKEARSQSSGVRYARELAESLRANKLVLADTSSPYFGDRSTAPTAFVCDALAGCGAGLPGETNLAKQDMSDWWKRASLELPGLRLVVCQDSQPYSATTNKAVWGCTAPAASTAGESVFIKMGWTQTNRSAAGTGTSANAAIVRTDTGVPLIVIPVVN